MRVRIGDFGLSRSTVGNNDDMTEYVVSRWYRAPEIILSSGKYGEIFSFIPKYCKLLSYNFFAVVL